MSRRGVGEEDAASLFTSSAELSKNTVVNVKFSKRFGGLCDKINFLLTI